MKKFIGIGLVLLLVVIYFVSKPTEKKIDNEIEIPKMNMEPKEPAPLTEIQKNQIEAGKQTHTASKLTFDINGGNFYYNPNEIHAKVGDTITVNFINDEGFHDFVIDELNVKTEKTNGGKTISVTFTPDKAGTFQFYCSVGEHRANGMVGNLIVQ